ncbi:MAG: class I SAM-dependent methyltransferase [Gemmatimonadota bacterium]|nr:class I SAM-dependent methyltransferase [Gemmatimonadota bacterium]MDE2985193.1 class I SAM-dependent methyltransferase [Gemmatimonadota bacterium]
MSANPWFRDWFGSEYLALYPHRDRAEGRRAVRLLRDATGLGPGTRVLDVGCGPGRHLAEMHRIGYRATGLDLSPSMLEAARAAVPDCGLVRADMRRLPFRAASFDVVTSYFTSFGYFEHADDDRGALLEARRLLRAGGWYLLDFLNAAEVVAHLKTEDRRTVSGMRVVQERRLADGGRIIEKRIRIEAGGDAPVREFVERVRLYRPEDLNAMLAGAGLTPGPTFGGYDRSPFSPASPRYIVLAGASG